jgi:hypothetical protein
MGHSPLLALYKSKRTWLFVLSPSDLKNINLKIVTNSTDALAQTSMSYVPDTEVFIDDKSVEWQPIKEPHASTILEYTDELVDEWTEYDGFIPITPHDREATSRTAHRVHVTQNGIGALPEKCHRYTYLFPATFYVGSPLASKGTQREIQHFKKKYRDFVIRGATVPVEFNRYADRTLLWDWNDLVFDEGATMPVKKLIELTDSAFLRWITEAGNVYHGKDVY